MAKKRTTGKSKKATARTAATVALPRSGEEREKVLYALLLEYDPSMYEYADALAALSFRSGLAVPSLTRYGSKNNWRHRWRAKWDTKGNEITAREVNEGIKAILNRDDRSTLDIPFGHITGNLKDLAYMVIARNKDMIEVAGVMIQINYARSRKIIDGWLSKGGDISDIPKADMTLVESYLTKAANAYKLVGDWMKPSAVTDMLNNAGIKEFHASGAGDGGGEGVMTAAELLKKMDELAMVSGGAIRQVYKDAELIHDVKISAEDALGPLPDVDGSIVKDEDNDYDPNAK